MIFNGIDVVFISVFLFAVVIGSYTDIKTREVPDWLNYGLIFGAFGLRLIFSLVSFDWSILIEGILGFSVFFALACIMFYTGQWGGGDAKMIMGIGALLGLRLDWLDFSLSFIANIFLIGALYALVWSIVLGVINRKRFVSEIKKLTRTPSMVLIRKIVLISTLLLIIGIFFIPGTGTKVILLLFIALYMLAFYLWIAVRAIERSCMLKIISPEKLTEGDWIAKPIIIGGKKIAGPKDLGVDKKQINELIQLKKKHKLKTVLIKEGIPFVPSFLLSFIATWFFGNLFLLVI